MFSKARSESVGSRARPDEKTLDPEDASITAMAATKKAAVPSAGLLVVPASFLGSATLQEIVLDYNRLTSVPGALLKLPALKKLSLVGNYISSLDPAAVVDCGKKLGTVSLENNPMAYPPSFILAKGWPTVKKWVAANPSFVTYRLFTREEGDFVHYVDLNYSGVRDTMVKSKDEDRDATYVVPYGQADDAAVRLPCIERHKRDEKPKAVQTNPGWCSAPFTGNHHVVPIKHMYLAVFDGHAGAWVAQALTTNLYKKLGEADVFGETPVEYEPVIRKVFMDLDKTICDKLRENNQNDGSTCVTLTLKGPDMIMAHVGDSRASAKIGKKDVELTEDHDPGVNKKEKERVEKRGGKVEFVKGCWRINQNLSVSRAFGDTNMKADATPIVDADPEVKLLPFNDEVEWLVIASDGLWHLMDNKDVIKLASSKLTAEEAALALFDDIATNTRSQLKGHDNCTILVVRCSHGRLPKSMVGHFKTPQ